MNKITNQSGEIVIAIGENFSMARMKQLYNLTMPKLIQRIHNSNAWSSIKDSSLDRDLCFLIEDDNIPNEHRQTLLLAAKYYCNEE